MRTQESRNGFPSQKKTRAQKTKVWAQQCVDYADNTLLLQTDGVRQSRRNKIINLNLYNGILDKRELSNYVNPNRTEASFLSEDIPHNPIIVPKIDLLVGEEYKRRFDWRATVTNPDAISEKEDAFKAKWDEKIQELMQSDLEDDQLQAEMQKYDKYMKHEWQDLRELRANRILRHFYKELDLRNVFNKGFKNALIMGEEIYQCDFISGLPHFTILNPIDVFTVRSGNSDRIEDSDLIIVDEYWSPGRVVDTYYDRLKPKDIKDLEGDFVSDGVSKHKGMVETSPNFFLPENEEFEVDVNQYIDLAGSHGYNSGNFEDSNGNIRVLRVYWRSLRKIKKVTFFDEFGDQQVDFFPEDYKAKEELGEVAETLWINEWWEGVKIKSGIYVNMRPRPIQYNQLDNPSICNPGIVGEIYSTSGGKAVSLVDRMKSFQYQFDAISDKTMKAIAKHYGPIMELDMAKIPANWGVEKWIHFARSESIAVIDSFKEGVKGTSTGKMAGAFNTSGRELKLDMGNYIQQNMNLMAYIKQEMSEIAGISPQREGAIQNRETVGGVERSVAQSSHITEYWFARHEDVKKRALSLLLETAKIAMKGKSKKMQFVAGDSSIQMMDLDGDDFSEQSYGLIVDSGSEYNDLQSDLRGLAELGLQNDKLRFSTIMDIYMSPSLLDIRRKIEKDEEAQDQANQEQANADRQAAQAGLEQAAALEEAKLAVQTDNNVRDNETKMAIAFKEDTEELPEDDSLERQKHRDDLMLRMKELQQDMMKHKDEMEIKEKEVVVKRIAANKKPAGGSSK